MDETKIALGRYQQHIVKGYTFGYYFTLIHSFTSLIKVKRLTILQLPGSVKIFLSEINLAYPSYNLTFLPK